MKLVNRMALVSALAFAAPAAMTLTAAPALAQALSAGVGKPLQQAQRLASAGNLAAATAQVNAARAAAASPAERRKVAEMAAYVHTRAGRFAAAAQELESVGAGPAQLAPLYYRAGNYGKAVALGNRVGGVAGKTIVAQAYLKQGKYADAAKVYESLIKSGGPRQQWLENLAGAQYKMGDKKAYLATTEKLIRVDPSPARWKALLVDLKGESMPREAKLALFQLMRETGNISRPEDYAEFAKLAIVANQPGVAKRALDEARAANAIAANDPMTAKLLTAAGQRNAVAMAGLHKLPRTAVGYTTAGNTQLGAGDYAKAAAAYQAALKAGADGNQTRLMLGISQLRAGNSAAARATFKEVPSGTAYGDVAALWALYASTKRG